MPKLVFMLMVKVVFRCLHGAMLLVVLMLVVLAMLITMVPIDFALAGQVLWGRAISDASVSGILDA